MRMELDIQIRGDQTEIKRINEGVNQYRKQIEKAKKEYKKSEIASLGFSD